MLLAAAVAFYVLQTLIVRDQGENSLVRTAVGRDVGQPDADQVEDRRELALQVAALLGILVYAVVALMWLVPDRRIERTVQHRVS